MRGALRRRRIGLTMSAFLATACLVAQIATVTEASAQSATLYVEPAASGGVDSGNCQTSPCATISYAVTDEASSGDTIIVMPGSYTDNVTISDMTNLTIEGQDPDSETITYGESYNGDSSESVFGLTNSQGIILNNLTIEDAPYMDVSIDDESSATLSNDDVTGSGQSANGDDDSDAGVYNDGTVTLQSDTISDNDCSGNADTDVYGGGLDNEGVATVEADTYLENNCAAEGGGIDNDGTMNVDSSYVEDNTANGSPLDEGGGIRNTDQLTMTNSTISGNTAGSSATDLTIGGGIYNGQGSTTSLSDSIVSNNTATGQNDGTSCRFRGLIHALPGSSGHRPPRVSIAMAMSASGE
jgi:hypothetical protein